MCCATKQVQGSLPPLFWVSKTQHIYKNWFKISYFCFIFDRKSTYRSESRAIWTILMLFRKKGIPKDSFYKMVPYKWVFPKNPSSMFVSSTHCHSLHLFKNYCCVDFGFQLIINVFFCILFALISNYVKWRHWFTCSLCKLFVYNL